jgi:hypothetical protein
MSVATLPEKSDWVMESESVAADWRLSAARPPPPNVAEFELRLAPETAVAHGSEQRTATAPPLPSETLRETVTDARVA